MKIIKECQDSTFYPKGKPPVTTTYVHLTAEQPSMGLKTLTELFNEAKKDFPTLREEDVTVSRSQPLTGISKMMAAAAGPVSFDSIGFEAPSAPPASYKRLRPTGFAQG
ncbi:MAG TPA: hypothetical protein VEF76_05040 [Patescibacteria group bacterium]|nr:hypothetical protein [Patescibacteria group bacterium]